MLFSTLPAHAEDPLGGTSLLGSNTVSATSQPAPGGGKSSAQVQGLSVLGASNVSASVVSSNCLMSSTGISGGTDTANLKVGNAAVNPGVNADIGVDNVLSGIADHETATYDTAPNSTITIPAPPTGYTVDSPTVTGGGTCFGVRTGRSRVRV